MKNVKKTKMYASGGNDFAGAIGERVTNAYRFKSEIKGALLPEPIFINDRGHLFFDGNSIKKLLDEHDFQ